ncbi:MAG: hypothetical protein AAF750_08875 [Planctomycetota bacterium]
MATDTDSPAPLDLPIDERAALDWLFELVSERVIAEINDEARDRRNDD